MSKRLAAIICLFAGAVFAQRSDRSMRATITGGGGDSGKCTIEVVVDQAADVEISGDTARLMTRSGQPAQFRRFQCNMVMPRNPVDFRFRGVDGRGNQQLVQQPQGRGVAVVHIEDPQGGSEGYTFDLEWRGGSGQMNGPYGNGPYGNAPYGNGPYGNGPSGNRDGHYDPRYDRNNDRHDEYRRESSASRQMITCSSDDGRRNYCNADTRDGVRMVRQRSDAACRQGSTWGYDHRGIWVDRGCRADFETGR